MVPIPEHVNSLLSALRAGGFEAYPVGGCVRDSLMGRVPVDWDLCSSARPEQVQQVFQGRRMVLTGAKHGTVTVVTQAGPVEITTFRADGAYLDGRHPASVRFLPRLEEDLARRDFTINAMALGPDGAVIDLYGGRADLRARLVRCVGRADRRFHEDALRILRALRFASKLDFAIEPETARAALEDRGLLDAIARERVFSELKGVLMGPGAGRVLLAFAPVIFQVIPELAAGDGFDQKSPHHCHDVWTHSALAVDAAPFDVVTRLAMLLHDVAKPGTFFTDEKGVGHFYGHGQAGAETADAILRRLRCDNAVRQAVTALIAVHDIQPPQTERAMKRLLARMGEEQTRRLIACWRADCADRPEAVRRRNGLVIDGAERALEGVLTEAEPCFDLRALAVNGRDILALGAAEGPAVGRVLRALLDQVIEGTIPNNRTALLARAGEMIEKIQRKPHGKPSEKRGDRAGDMSAAGAG